MTEERQDEVEVNVSQDLERLMSTSLFHMNVRLIQDQHDRPVSYLGVRAGCFTISRFHYVGDVKAVSRRSWNQVRNDASQVYLFCFPVIGGILTTQNGHSDFIGEGAFTITRSTAPHRFETSRGDAREHQSLTLSMPSYLARGMMPAIDEMCGQAFPADGHSAATARNLLADIALHGKGISDELNETLALAAFQAIKETLTGSWAGRSSQARVSVEALLHFIDQHISDPHLAISKIAGNFDISPAYVQSMLWRHGVSFKKYVWDTRYGRAYERIGDCRFRGDTIARIAFEQGFKSNAHFSRGFKERFGISPKDLRRRMAG